MATKKRSKGNNSKVTKIVLYSLIGIVLAVFSGVFTYQYSNVKYYDNLIYPGVNIEGVNVTGKTKEQAKLLVKNNYWNKLMDKKVIIKAKNSTYTLKYSDLKPTNNLDQVINKSMEYGKDLFIFSKYKIIKEKPKKNFTIHFKYDEKAIDVLINKIANEVNVEPKDASLELSGNGFNVISQENGEQLEKDKLKKSIISKVDDDSTKDIYEEISMKIIKPKITADQLQGMGRQIGSFATQYGSISSPQRANNIEIATQAVNGKLLMSGDVFSFNGVVGPRTAEKGYMAAPVIIGDKVEDGLGGGVCQVSSTLFNAINSCNLETTERSHHTKKVSYVPDGMDATVDYGNIDFKFRNNLSSPVYIQGYANGGNLVFNVYSK